MSTIGLKKSVLGVLAAGAAALTMAFTTTATEPVKAAKVGEKAPEFTLKDTSGTEYALSKLTAEGKIVVLEWFNPECPFVVLHHEKNTTMADTYAKYKDKGVTWLAINSGAAGKQGHGLEKNKAKKDAWKIAYPILLDETGTVGKAYGAKTTPHMYIITKDGTLAYAGAIDDYETSRKAGQVNYVANALDQILANETVTTAETKSYGCSVKY